MLRPDSSGKIDQSFTQPVATHVFFVTVTNDAWDKEGGTLKGNI